jgi:hypothetical protein
MTTEVLNVLATILPALIALPIMYRLDRDWPRSRVLRYAAHIYCTVVLAAVLLRLFLTL